MATSILITCPHCGKQLRASGDLQGKKVRCKGCGQTFPVKRPDDKAEEKPAAAAPADEWNDRNPYGLSDTNLAPRCPFCATELEDEEQVICLNCGYNTRTRQRAVTKMTYHTTGMDYFLWWLPGILCVGAILFLIVLDIVYVIVARDWIRDRSDRDEWIWVILHYHGVKTWVVIFSLFAMFFAGRFAIKRLIFHSQPPEKEKKKKGDI